MNEKENRFVAFIDIAGYKNLIKKKPKAALPVVKEFFRIGYFLTKEYPEILGKIKGIFVSDCGIIWTNEKVNEENSLDMFKLILTAIKKFNEKTINNQIMKKNRIMLSTSIAFGEFYPIETVEHEYISKNLIYGQAYIDAYLDSNTVNPGLCRIITEDIPEELSRALNPIDSTDPLLSLVHKYNNETYFYWNCIDIDDISTFMDQYQKAKDIKYQMMFDALSRKYHSERPSNDSQ